MPAKPRWLLQIPSIIAALSDMTSPVVDRAVFEALFGLRRRQAIALLSKFGGYRSANTLLVDRLALIEQLQVIQSHPDTELEIRRKERIAEQIVRLQCHRAAARVRIPVAADVHSRRLRDLPQGIRIEPGRLTIEFADTEQLLSNLYELSQAAANDFELFRAETEGGPVQGSHHG
jgi:hypothetical protein